MGSKKEKFQSHSTVPRRSFLSAASLAGIALCLPQAEGIPDQKATESESVDKQPTFCETEIMRAYYERARF